MTIAWIEAMEPTAALAQAGAKLARLAELRRLGVRVPEGFALTTAAYRDFLEASRLTATIESVLDELTDPTDSVALEAAAAQIRAAFESAPMLPAVAEMVAQAYEALCDRRGAINLPVAVRSSATGEDAAHASFAGQFETYLGLTGVEEILQGIRDCWASLFNARAIGYRLEHGLAHHDSPMAVGILELVNARASGVAFSLHPVTGKRDRIVVEATWGWGEALVQGLVTPDHYEIDKSDGRILKREVNHKRVVSAFDYRRGRVVETEMPARLRERTVLDDEELGVIATTVGRIEAYYGHPVDVEWVLDGARRPGEPATFVQTRPITVATPAAANVPKWDLMSAVNQYVLKRPS